MLTIREAKGADFSALKVAIVGDVLFQGSIGRTDLPGGDHEVLLGSIAKKFLTRDDDVVVLPGHGPQTWSARTVKALKGLSYILLP